MNSTSQFRLRQPIITTSDSTIYQHTRGIQLCKHGTEFKIILHGINQRAQILSLRHVLQNLPTFEYLCVSFKMQVGVRSCSQSEDIWKRISVLIVGLSPNVHVYTSQHLSIDFTSSHQRWQILFFKCKKKDYLSRPKFYGIQTDKSSLFLSVASEQAVVCVYIYVYIWWLVLMFSMDTKIKLFNK